LAHDRIILKAIFLQCSRPMYCSVFALGIFWNATQSQLLRLLAISRYVS